MKLKFIILLCSVFAVNKAQDGQTIPESKLRVSFTYGVTGTNPTNINEHISTSNAVFNSQTKSIKSLPEAAATLSFRPNDDLKVVVLRGGWISAERNFSFSTSATQNSSTPTGTIDGTIKETYTAYPISVGVGISTVKSDAQFQIEFIYALGYVKEEGKYTAPSGAATSYTRSLFSPTYGFRAAGSIVARITSSVGLQFEAGYRYLHFNEFEDEFTAQPSPIEFSMTGIQGSVGLSITL
jgi:hypothetical protein